MMSHPSIPPSASRRRAGWTAVEIVFGVLAALLLFGIALPAFFKTRPQRQANACARNLDDIATASRRYAVERGGFPASIGALVPDFLPSAPSCPAGGVYALGTPEGDPPVCSVHCVFPVTGVLP